MDTNHGQNRERTKAHRALLGTGVAAVAVALCALALHIGWNLAVPDVFGASELSFRNAVGLSALALLVGWTARWIAGWSRRCDTHR